MPGALPASAIVYCTGLRCRRFLAEAGSGFAGRVRIQCPGCKSWYWLSASDGGLSLGPADRTRSAPVV